MSSSKRNKQYWLIEGYDGLNRLFEHKIYVGQITNNNLKELLKVLTSKISLTEREIISSYAKKGTKAHQNFLVVQHLEGDKFMYSCGENPYVTATAHNENSL